MCIKIGRILDVIGNVPGKYYASFFKYRWTTLKRIKIKTVVMNLVIPVSVPFIRHHISHVPRLSRGAHSF